MGPALETRQSHTIEHGVTKSLVIMSHYAEDSTLMAVVPFPGVRVAEADSLIRDLGWVSEYCDLWGMKLNASKTKTMIVSRSRTMHPQAPPLTIGGMVLKESDDLVILVVTLILR